MTVYVVITNEGIVSYAGTNREDAEYVRTKIAGTRIQKWINGEHVANV